MHSMEYDRDGVPISLERWAQLKEQYDYAVVEKTFVEAVEVSTVWLGIDHNFLGGTPIIFETMLFTRDLIPTTLFGRVELVRDDFGYQWRYATEASARAGHWRIVHSLRLLGALYARFHALTRHG